MRRALLVGIDNYTQGSLRGCVSDAERLATMLATHHDGSPNFDCRQLTATSGDGLAAVTRAKLRVAIEELFGQKADVALFHFSGHGSQSATDGYLVTQDVDSCSDGLAMAEVLAIASNSPCEEVIILIDCCHSGHMGSVPMLAEKGAILREGVSIIAASRAAQPSVEVDGGGLFTSLVLDALDGGAADILGEVTIPSIYAKIEAALGAWDQRPLFKSHVNRVLSLRKCRPPIPRDTLRDLPELFPVPAEDFPLTPEYEETSPARVEAKVQIFHKLQSLNRVHLVVPIGVAHMYDAAMQSTGCRLTAAGRYYWRLAANRRI